MALLRKRLSIDGWRLALRPLRDGDLDQLVDAANDPSVARYTRVPYPYTKEHAANFIAMAGEQLRLQQAYHLCVLDKEDDDRLVGMIALLDLDEESERAEVGYWIGPKDRGKGFATEALALAIEIAFERLGLTRLYAFVLEHNEASVKVLEHMGFHEEGRLRWHTKRKGAWMDKVWYGLLREEWEALPHHRRG